MTDSCYSDGLPRAGATDCAACCFDGSYSYSYYSYSYSYDYDDDQIETGTCLEEWSDDADDGCTDQQYGCPAVACDGDEKPWCSAVGGGWFFCDPDTDGSSI